MKAAIVPMLMTTPDDCRRARCLIVASPVSSLRPMRLLDRYLLRELLTPLGYCLMGFLVLIVTADLTGRLDDFHMHRMHFGDVCLYYAVQLPEMLVKIMPMTLLLALLYALTNHSRNNEITAIRAAGVSLWRLALPYFVVGLLASMAMFAVNEFWVPDADARADQILRRRDAPKTNPAGRFVAANVGITSSKDAERR